MLTEDEFKSPFLVFLAEVFGVSGAPGGYFLDTGRSGLLGTLDNIDAVTASTPLKSAPDTIAAHAAHVLYILRFFSAHEQGRNPEPDWPGSWTTHRVDEESWNRLRDELRTTYEFVVVRLKAREEWQGPAIGASMMLLAHCAYHVGVIHRTRTVILSG
jgi:hypothetical protein